MQASLPSGPVIGKKKKRYKSDHIANEQSTFSETSKNRYDFKAFHPKLSKITMLAFKMLFLCCIKHILEMQVKHAC